MFQPAPVPEGRGTHRESWRGGSFISGHFQEHEVSFPQGGGFGRQIRRRGLWRRRQLLGLLLLGGGRGGGGGGRGVAGEEAENGARPG